MRGPARSQPRRSSASTDHEMEKLKEKNKKLKNEVNELKRTIEWYMKREAEERRLSEIEANLRVKVEDSIEKFFIYLEKSQQEPTKQIEEYWKEVDCLRGELQQVKVDGDCQLEHMIAELKKI